MDLCIKDSGIFLDSFEHVLTKNIDEHNKTKLELFVLNINSNEFNYTLLKERLLDPLIDFALSRKIRAKYKTQPGTLSKKARQKFVNHLSNKGELGELLLFAFLETHLKAPKLLSKLELKTATNNYVNGSDGVHFLKLDSGDFQLIFGESKTIENMTTAFSDAFKSIYEFKSEINKDGKEKSGLPYEKSLINDQLVKETFSSDERKFIEKIIYPTKESNFQVDDAFAIFIGFELKISDEEKKMGNEEFRKLIHSKIKKEVEKRYKHIETKISEYQLWGHHFYIYVLPFTDLDITRLSIQEYIT
jgi:hypothetical protein